MPCFAAEQLTFANQLLRPIVEIKSPVKEQTISQLMRGRKR